MLLDTSFLIDLMRGDDGAVAKASDLEASLVQQRIASMSLFELFYGVARTNHPERERETIEAVLATKPVLAADDAVMRKAGRLAGELETAGTPVDDGDAIIGATAEVVEEPVLTRNVRDFERLDVTVETY